MYLRSVMISIPNEDKVLLLRDFNALIGYDYERWGALERHGFDKMNVNNLRILFCTDLDYVICNAVIRLKDINKLPVRIQALIKDIFLLAS